MVLHGRLCGRVDNRRLFFVFVLGWRTYCVSYATHVVGTYVSTPPCLQASRLIIRIKLAKKSIFALY